MTSIDRLIANTIRADVRAVASYVVADASGFIKLDAMENPYQLPAELHEELGRRLAAAALNRYPVASYASLKEAICEELGVPDGYNVILGNGSDELIAIIDTATARQDQRATVLAPVPAFVMYQRSAQFAGMDFVGVPLTADFALDMPAMRAAIAQHQPAVLYLAYPNNPTGNLFDAADMAELIDLLGEKGIAVIDEAYEPFAQTSFMEHLPEFPNLVVMRTLSKLGLAGIRLGYMSAAPALLAQFDKVRPPYNVNVLTQVAAEFALEHIDILDAQADSINAARTVLAADLAALAGVTVFESSANFLLFRVADSAAVTDKLAAAKVLVKNLGKMHPLLANCIRVTVSTPDENAAFMAALAAALTESTTS
ncbi:histidinol-phosphate transaminase [Massilia sp. DWR3-1-1]|uniref:histidinol-phosphate transaminase n=1 Tax=Massilia sp. DWR3-1-1 TaxID=2804559 RepID=UPI003CEF943C